MTLDERGYMGFHGTIGNVSGTCLENDLRCFTHFFGQAVQLLPIFEILKALAFALGCFLNCPSG